MRNLFFACLFLLASCACGAPREAFLETSNTSVVHMQSLEPSASQVYLMQKNLIKSMQEMYPSVQAHLFWMPCGEYNSFYVGAGNIVLCTEFSDYPSVALFAAAHEMGHSITDQLTDTTSEIDADELAALSMIKLGYGKELLETAVYSAQQENQDHISGDPHPSNAFRAWYLACLEVGSEAERGAPKECVELYHATKLKWDARLGSKT